MSIQDLVEAAVIRALEKHDSKVFAELEHVKDQMKRLEAAVDWLVSAEKETQDADAKRGSVPLSAFAR